MAHSLDSAFGTASVSNMCPRCWTCGVKVEEGVRYCDDICDKLKLTDEMVRAYNTRRDGKNWYLKAEYTRVSI